MTIDLSTEGTIATLVADPRLARVDAMGIDHRGNLLMPASLLDRSAGFHDGVDVVKPPIVLDRLAIGATAVRR